MKNIVIIEDEPLTAQSLKESLAIVAPDCQVVATLASLEESTEWFNDNDDYQLVFMDIQIADGIVFELFDTVEISCPVIFTTAYDQYAIQAFKVNSIDYLLKPYTQDDLKKALDKVRRLETYSESLQEKDMRKKLMEELKVQLQGGARSFLSVAGDQLIPISTDDTAYYVVDKHTVTAVDYQNKRYRLDFNMDELASKLDPSKFYRANRQYMVAHKAIKEIYFGFGGKLELRLNVPVSQNIVISRTKTKEFKLWYSGL